MTLGEVDVRLARVSAEPIDVDAVEALVRGPRAGAVVTFRGTVRDHDHGRAVTRLDYQAHPSAEAVLGRVAAGLLADPGVLAVAVVHRIGTLGIGDDALVAAVAAPHRGEAFAAIARLVDAIKALVPIWKRQVFADGTDEWVDCP